MQIQAPFGFVTSCYAGDKFMVQATLASMRHYCPDIPICLIVDGDVDVSDLQKEYRPIILRIADLPDARMRELIAGSTRSKLAAMWAGPFEHYVWMDSDAIVWGDFTAQIRRDLDFQIMWSDSDPTKGAHRPPSWLLHFYLDPDKLRIFDPAFEWRGASFFTDGAFACRKDVFSFEDWVEVLSWKEHEHSPWPKDFRCQPMMNYLVNSRAQRGQIKIAVSDLQYKPRFHGRSEIDGDCKRAGYRFPERIERPRVVHLSGRKPMMLDPWAYSRAFTIARLEHYRRSRGELGAWTMVLREEIDSLLKKLHRRFKKVVGRN